MNTTTASAAPDRRVFVERRRDWLMISWVLATKAILFGFGVGQLPRPI